VRVPKCDWRIDARRCQQSGPGGKRRPVEQPLPSARASRLVVRREPDEQEPRFERQEREGRLAAGPTPRPFSGRAQAPQPPGAQRGPAARAFVREEQAP
jgi:hypothetical protein